MLIPLALFPWRTTNRIPSAVWQPSQSLVLLTDQKLMAHTALLLSAVPLSMSTFKLFVFLKQENYFISV